MTPQQNQRIEELFLAAMAVPPGEQAAFLREHCADDSGIAAEVASLLGHVPPVTGQSGPSPVAGEQRRFLDTSAAPGRGMMEHAGPLAPDGLDEPMLPEGTVVADYTIMRVLGVGGMGVVYVAQQNKPRRTVALKVLRAALASPRLLRRFEFEAEVLGRLHHPGIAQVYEAGTFRDGLLTRPYIAMELVRGLPLLEYARRGELSVASRLTLLADICDAVQHAHQCGVIHRDLKPANILVQDNSEPQPENGAVRREPGTRHLPLGASAPKVLDFGVARAMSEEPGQPLATAHTNAGQIVGTLPYMSPEQVVGDPSRIDTRSDVYSLGVVGFELLSGRLPYDIAKAPLPEAARVIRDESPTRLSAEGPQFRGDIEIIIATALAKDPARRYQSAADMATDIRRHLAGEPIGARRDSAFYVISTHLRRHKALVGAACLSLIGMMAFAVYAVVQAELKDRLARQAQFETAKARAQETRADTAARDLANELSLSTIDRGRLLGLSGNLSAAEDLLWPAHLRNLGSHHTFYALWELYSHQPWLAAIPAHEGQISRLAISPDQELVASSGTNPGVCVYEAATQKLLLSLKYEGTCVSLAFSPDSNVLAAGGSNGSVSLWNPRSGELVSMVRAADNSTPGRMKSGPCTSLAFSRHGDLAASFERGLVMVWPGSVLDAGTEPAEPLKAVLPEQRTVAVAFSPDGGGLAVVAEKSLIRIYTPDLSSHRELDEETPAELASAVFSPSGRLLAVAGARSYLSVFNVAPGPEFGRVTRLEAANGTIRGVGFGVDDSTLFCSGWWRIIEWDVAAAKARRAFSALPTGYLMCVDTKRNHLWSTSGGSLRILDLHDPGATRLYPPSPGRTVTRYCRDGEHVLMGDADGSVTLARRTTGQTVALLGKPGTRRVRSIAMSPADEPDTAIAATASTDGFVRLWSLAERRMIAEWPGLACPTNRAIAFSPSGKRLVSPAPGGAFEVRSVPDGATMVKIPPQRANGYNESLAACFSPDGGRIVGVSREEGPRVYDANDGTLIAECQNAGATVWTLAFSPDGEQIVGGDWSSNICIWNAHTGVLERRLAGHRALVTDLMFRQKEPNILVSSSADGTVRFWDLGVQASTPVLTLEPPGGWEVWNVDVSPTKPDLLCTDGRGNTTRYRLRWYNQHIVGNLLAQYKLRASLLGDSIKESDILEWKALMERGLRSANEDEALHDR